MIFLYEVSIENSDTNEECEWRASLKSPIDLNHPVYNSRSILLRDLMIFQNIMIELIDWKNFVIGLILFFVFISNFLWGIYTFEGRSIMLRKTFLSLSL